MSLDPVIVNEDLLQTNQQLRHELDRARKAMYDGLLFTVDEIETAFNEIDPHLFSEAQRCGLTGEQGETIERFDVWKSFHRMLMKQRADRELYCGPKPRRSEANQRIRSGK